MRKKILGFSVMELMIMLVTVSVITAALAPVVTKRITNSRTIANATQITTHCEAVDEKCNLCQIKPTEKICLACTRKCTENETLDFSNCKCLKCDSFSANCKNCNSIGCTKCNDGYYIKTGKCTLCPAGHECDGKTATPCPLGSIAQEGDGVCTPCEDWEMALETVCKKCPDGKFVDYYSRKGCISCLVGHYCPGGIMQECPKGTYQPRQNEIRCDITTPGHYQDQTGQTEQKPCPIGTFQPNSQSTACVECGTGTYADKPGTSKCTVSTAIGCFFPSTTSNTCLTCKAGYYMSSKGVCSQCNSGYYTKDDNTDNHCEQYTAQNCKTYNPDANKCSSCLAGYGFSNGVCSLCPGGQYSPGGTSACSKNTASNCHEYKKDSAGCISCKAGYALSNGQCIACSDGYYSSNGNKSSCSQNTANNCSTKSKTANLCTGCKVGYGYSNGTCINCGSGYWSSGGTGSCSKNTQTGCNGMSVSSNECTSCIAGYVLKNGTCKPCPIGEYMQNNSCKQCPTGEYKDNQSDVSCKSCSKAHQHCTECDRKTGYCTKCESGYTAKDGECIKACQVANCEICMTDNTGKYYPDQCWLCSSPYRVDPNDRTKCTDTRSCENWGGGNYCGQCYYGCAADKDIFYPGSVGCPSGTLDGKTLSKYRAPNCYKCKDGTWPTQTYNAPDYGGNIRYCER